MKSDQRCDVCGKTIATITPIIVEDRTKPRLSTAVGFIAAGLIVAAIILCQ